MHFALRLLVLQIQHNEATVAVLTVLAVSVVMAVSIMTATYAWGEKKQHEKCHCHTAFCVPQMLVKTRI